MSGKESDQHATSSKLAIGVITKPHGVHGAVKVMLHWENSTSLTRGLKVYLQPATSPPSLSGTGKEGEGRAGRRAASGSKTLPDTPCEHQSYLIEELSIPNRGVIVVAFQGVETFEEAQALRGLQVLMDRDDLEPPGEDEYFYCDLVGLRVVRDDGRELGRITDVFGTAASDVISVQTVQGTGIMLPMIQDLVASLDLEGGTLTVYGVDGMTDDESLG